MTRDLAAPNAPEGTSFGASKSRRREARTYLAVLLASVALLNILAISKEMTLATHIVASMGILLAGLPMWHFLARSREMLPFFPMIAIVYAVYFVLPALMPVDPYIRFAGLAPEVVFETLALSVAGIGVLVLSYAGVLPGLSFRPRSFFPKWSIARARFGAVILGLAGLLAILMLRFGDAPAQLEALVVFASTMSLLSLAILFLLLLCGALPARYVAGFWIYLAALILFYVSTGLIFPLVKMAALLALIYVGYRRTIPWKAIALGLVVLIPLVVFKYEFRAATWELNRPGASSLLEVPDQLVTYSEIISSSAQTAGPIERQIALQVVLNRVDLLHTFSHYRSLTPETIPHLDGATYTNLLWKLVPRILYPDKPEEDWGQKGGHMFGLIDPRDDQTAVNFAQMPEMYVNFGTMGVLIGMYLLAQVYRVLSRLMNYPQAGLWSAAPAALVFSLLTQIESNFTLVFGGLVYTIPLLFIVMLILRKRSVSRPRTTS